MIGRLFVLHRFRRQLTFCIPLALFALFSSVHVDVARADDKDTDERVFELRTYITNDGKLDALHKRFREHTNELFEKHGMTIIGYWTPKEGDEAQNTLVYLLAFPDAEAKSKAWKDFLADPEWHKVYAASIKDGRLVKQVISKMLTPTDYSPLK